VGCFYIRLCSRVIFGAKERSLILCLFRIVSLLKGCGLSVSDFGFGVVIMASIIPTQWLLCLGAAFLVSAVVAFAGSGLRRKEELLRRFQLNKRRVSGASTPPRQLTGGKRGSVSVTDTLDFINTFPPSRRCALSELNASEKSSVSIGPEPSTNFLVNDALPTTRSYNLENDAPKYTPTGFSTAEIKSMGDFPAYDILSGVPLPEPYQNYDPTKALPRPYRPFRWAYHQTMCKLYSN
jgi:hypothetical protein